MTQTSTPHGEPDLGALAPVLGDPSRVRVLAALVDGRALPTSVLAAEAGVSASAMSAHLAKLLDAGLVVAERSGRHRYFRLAGAAVADLVESMSVLAPPRPVTSMRSGSRARTMRRARTCYDHLAGRLGVAVTQELVETGVLVPRDGVADLSRRRGEGIAAQLGSSVYVLGPDAAAVLGEWGIDLDVVRRGRRPLLRFCLDWSEQRHHLSGALGGAVLELALHKGWVRRRPGVRALEVSAEAEQRWLT